jgi:hypothetical protein
MTQFRVVRKRRSYWPQDWYVLQEKWGPFWVDCKLGPETNLFNTVEQATAAAKWRNRATGPNANIPVSHFER